MALCGVIALNQSASDPGSPTSGQIYWNTTSNVVKIYDGLENNAWYNWELQNHPSVIETSNTVYATGGDVICCGGGYVCHIFYNSANLYWTKNSFSIDNIYVMAVGGGGGGGYNAGGGGGGALAGIVGNNNESTNGDMSKVKKGCFEPCAWRGPFCWNTDGWDNNDDGYKIPVLVGAGGAGSNYGSGSEGGSSSLHLILSSTDILNMDDDGEEIIDTSLSSFPNSVARNMMKTSSDLDRCNGEYPSGYSFGQAIKITTENHNGGGGSGNGLGVSSSNSSNGGSASCSNNIINCSDSYPNGGNGNCVCDPFYNRSAGGGGNYGSDQYGDNPRSIEEQNAGINNILYGGTGTCGWKLPQNTSICVSGGGAGGSYMGSSNCNNSTVECNDIKRTCTNNTGVGGCGGSGCFPILNDCNRFGGNACTINHPYDCGWVGSGGGGGGYNGTGGNGSSGFVIIKYPCVFTEE